MDNNLKCGFCKQGNEVQNICGKLWHDEAHKCTSHQRCMQYSALLCQYKMKKFGGFKIKEVLKEQARGNKLKCSICQKLGKSSKGKIVGGSASAGCAIQKCKKTFHFYCARVDDKTKTQRIVMGKSDESQDSVVLYRVFCCQEHETKFLEPGMEVTQDSSNEEYSSSSTSDGELVVAKKESQSTQKEESVTNEGGHGRKSKKIKLDVDSEKKIPETLDRSEAPYGQAFVVCFVENTRNISPPKFETLAKQAKRYFDVKENGVFMWKYNADAFLSHHVLHLLVEIGNALRDRNKDGLHRLVCMLGRSDLERFDELTPGVGSEGSASEEYRLLLRKQIIDQFEKVNESFGHVVVKYCTLDCDDGAQAAYLVLSDETDPSGGIRQQLQQSYSLNQQNGNLEKVVYINLV